MRPWVETAQRPTTRKSGNAQLQEAPSCFEAEVMEEDRAHSGLQTHGHVGLGARACQGSPTPTQRAACSGRFFPCEAPVARWHLPSVLPGVILTSLGIVDATRKQDLSAFCRAHLLPAVAIVVAASALGSRLGRRGRGSRLMRLCPLTP